MCAVGRDGEVVVMAVQIQVNVGEMAMMDFLRCRQRRRRKRQPGGPSGLIVKANY